MQDATKQPEYYRVVAVRVDGGEVVLADHMPEPRAESVRDALIDSRAFADIRIERDPGRPGQKGVPSRESGRRQTQAL